MARRDVRYVESPDELWAWRDYVLGPGGPRTSDGRLTCTLRLCAVVLGAWIRAEHADPAHLWTTHGKLAEALGISKRASRNAIAVLEEQGFIERVHSPVCRQKRGEMVTAGATCLCGNVGFRLQYPPEADIHPPEADIPGVGPEELRSDQGGASASGGVDADIEGAGQSASGGGRMPASTKPFKSRPDSLDNPTAAATASQPRRSERTNEKGGNSGGANPPASDRRAAGEAIARRGELETALRAGGDQLASVAQIPGLALAWAWWLHDRTRELERGSVDVDGAHGLVARVLDDMERKRRRFTPDVFLDWLARAIRMRSDPKGTGEDQPDEDLVREAWRVFGVAPAEGAPADKYAGLSTYPDHVLEAIENAKRAPAMRSTIACTECRSPVPVSHDSELCPPCRARAASGAPAAVGDGSSDEHGDEGQATG